MSGFDQWLPGGLNSAIGAFASPVWVAGALAALMCFVGVLAFARAAQIGRASAAWRLALVLVGAGLMWVLVDSLGGRDHSAARRVLDARSAELTLRAIAPGSPLACLETVENATIEAACEKSLFASPEVVAAAVAYVDARLTLLADSLELVARDRGYGPSIERLRRAIEADRFGVVAHVLATRGCTPEDCAPLKLLRDPARVAANLRERHFDANVVLHASAWHSDAPAAAAAASSGPAVAATPHVAVTGTAQPPTGRFEYPSAASIPAISIMNAEPMGPPAETSAAPAPPAAPAPAARAPAPRRQSAREPPQTPQQMPPQAQQPAQSVPMPLAPPGTLSNPR